MSQKIGHQGIGQATGKGAWDHIPCMCSELDELMNVM